MKYRPFGKTDFQVSALGFGIMRMPILNNDSGRINEPVAIDMIRTAIDNGINYIDTAWLYHKETSEALTGKALKDGYREKVKVATKLPIWKVEEPADFDRLLDEQLRRLDIAHIDYYLIHSLNKKHWEITKSNNVIRNAEEALKDGRIKSLGFSFHDELPLFKEIIDSYDNWGLAQIQYNFMDENYQAGKTGLQYASGKGIPVVVMEPLRGGQLAQPAPESVKRIWQESSNPSANEVERALAWIWDQKEVTTVLSGMNTMEQLMENIGLASKLEVGMLSEKEQTLYERAREEYLSLKAVPCTKCEYCMPCPEGVNIPQNFVYYNEAKMYGHLEGSKDQYASWFADSQHADKCIRCGQCEPKCPQNIPIMDQLAEVDSLLG